MAGYPELLEHLDALAHVRPRETAMQEMCVFLHDNVPHYNWVGFYLVDPPGSRELKLGPFVGARTEHVRIPFGRGICGQAAERRAVIVVPDVSQEANYLACSLDVRSEIVLPLIKDDVLLGELDIDSHTPDAFSEQDTAFLTRVCSIVSSLFRE